MGILVAIVIVIVIALVAGRASARAKAERLVRQLEAERYGTADAVADTLERLIGMIADEHRRDLESKRQAAADARAWSRARAAFARTIVLTDPRVVAELGRLPPASRALAGEALLTSGVIARAIDARISS